MAHDEIGAHARDELGITEVADREPLQAAWTSAVAFTAGAIWPVLAVALADIDPGRGRRGRDAGRARGARRARRRARRRATGRAATRTLVLSSAALLDQLRHRARRRQHRLRRDASRQAAQSMRRSSVAVALPVAHVLRGGMRDLVGPTHRSRCTFAGTPSAIAPLGTSMPLGHERARAHECAGADDGAVQHDGAGSDERAVLDDAAFEVREVTDRAVVADRGLELRVQCRPRRPGSTCARRSRCGSGRRATPPAARSSNPRRPRRCR